MDLKIRLTAQEEADIHGWVNYYAANPGKIGTPEQYRIVLDSRTAERYNEVAAQFAAPPVVVPPPSTGDPWVWPVDKLSPLWGEELRTTLNTWAVSAIPIDPPVSGQIYLSCAEFGTASCTRQVCFSTKAGDFVNPISNIGSGNTASATVAAIAGERVYFNIRFWSSDLNMPSTNDDSAGVVIGGNWPR